MVGPRAGNNGNCVVVPELVAQEVALIESEVGKDLQVPGLIVVLDKLRLLQWDILSGEEKVTNASDETVVTIAGAHIGYPGKLGLLHDDVLVKAVRANVVLVVIDREVTFFGGFGGSNTQVNPFVQFNVTSWDL